MPSSSYSQQYSIKGPDGRYYTPDEYHALAADTGGKEKERAALESDYGAASTALAGAKTADVGEYERTAPFAKQVALSRLAGRGLGRSVMGNAEAPGETNQGGYGSGALRETDVSLTKGLESILSNYQSLGQGLERQKLGESINLDDFYRNLATARQSAQSKKAGIMDYLSLGPSVAGLFL